MRQEKTDKRQAILDAALELCAEHGFHGAPISMIAARAGVGVGTIYRYFQDKDELLIELFRALHRRVRAQIYADYPTAEPLRGRFLFLFTRLLRFFLEAPLEFRYLEQFHYSPYGVACQEEMAAEENNIRDLLIEGREQQIIKDAPLPLLEAIAFGPIVALAKEQISGRVEVDEAMIACAVAACWDGLKR
jgi:TetR/AcrR family transcriptional regulator, repressor of fatR-cypB operon